MFKRFSEKSENGSSRCRDVDRPFEKLCLFKSEFGSIKNFHDKISLWRIFLGFKQGSASEYERTSFGFHTFGYSVIWNNSAGFKCIFWSLLHNIDLEYECHHITFMTSRDKSFSLILLGQLFLNPAIRLVQVNSNDTFYNFKLTVNSECDDQHGFNCQVIFTTVETLQKWKFSMVIIQFCWFS